MCAPVLSLSPVAGADPTSRSMLSHSCRSMHLGCDVADELYSSATFRRSQHVLHRVAHGAGSSDDITLANVPHMRSQALLLLAVLAIMPRSGPATYKVVPVADTKEELPTITKVKEGADAVCQPPSPFRFLPLAHVQTALQCS